MTKDIVKEVGLTSITPSTKKAFPSSRQTDRGKTLRVMLKQVTFHMVITFPQISNFAHRAQFWCNVRHWCCCCSLVIWNPNCVDLTFVSSSLVEGHNNSMKAAYNLNPSTSSYTVLELPPNPLSKLNVNFVKINPNPNPILDHQNEILVFPKVTRMAMLLHTKVYDSNPNQNQHFLYSWKKKNKLNQQTTKVVIYYTSTDESFDHSK